METLSTNNQDRRFLQIFTKGTILAKFFMAVLIVCTNCISANAQDWHKLYKKGQEYEKKSMTVKAMTCYEEALKISNNDTILRAVANCLYMRGYYRKCINLCREIIERDENNEDLTLIAKCYEKISIPDSSVVYQKILANREIENYSNLMSLARNLADIQEYDTAIVYLDRYYKVDSTNLIVNTQRAYTLFQLERFKEAEAEYRKLLDAGMENIGINYYLGMACSSLGKKNDARDYLYRAVKMSQRGNAYILAKYGAAAVESGSVVEGRNVIEEAIEKLQPDTTFLSSLRYMQAKAYMTYFDYDNGIKYYKMAWDLDHSQYNVLYMIARAYGLNKDHKNEEKYLRMFVDKVNACEEDEEKEVYEKLLATAEKRLSELKVEKFFKGEQ